MSETVKRDCWPADLTICPLCKADIVTDDDHGYDTDTEKILCPTYVHIFVRKPDAKCIKIAGPVIALTKKVL